MTGSKSRDKGQVFERTVAKMFAKALNLQMRRTPLSGGWSHDNPNVVGDLVCTSGEFPYCVECKCVEGWKLESLFTDNHRWFDAWWEQLIGECPNDKVPVLAFSRARQPIFAAIKYTYEASMLELESRRMIIQCGDTRVCIVLLSDLLRSLTLTV